jgi:hypothetical protein
MSEKKVTLRFEVADNGASSQLEKIAKGAESAAANTKKLSESLASASTPNANPFAAMGQSGTATSQQSNTLQSAFASMAASSSTPSRQAAGVTFGDLLNRGKYAGGSMDMAALAQSPSNPYAPATAGYRAKYDDHMQGSAIKTDRNIDFQQPRGPLGRSLEWMGNRGSAVGSNLARFGARAIPYAAAFEAVGGVGNATHSAALVDYQGGSASEQMRTMANSTFLSRQVIGISDSIRGRQQQFEKVDYDERLRQVTRDAAEQERMMVNQFRQERMGLEARRDVLAADGRMARITPTDRSTVTGERDFQRQMQLQPSQQASLDAEKELAMAKRVQAQQESMKSELERRVVGLEVKRGKLSAEAEQQGGAEKYESLSRVNAYSREIESARRELDTLNRDIEKSRGEIVKLDTLSKEAKIDVMRGRLNITEQRESIATTQAQSVGSLNPYEFAQSRQAALLLKQNGIGAVPPDLVPLAARVAPQMVRKLQEGRGAAWNQQLMNDGFSEYEDLLPEIRKKRDDESNKLIDAIRDLKRESAKTAVDQLLAKEFQDAMIALARKMAAAEVEKIKNSVKMENTKR